ncbi:MAG: hypothetical protein GX030_03490 [Firmicutes bacterium]|nr:hypothetical protein [Bacillota bacterium]
MTEGNQRVESRQASLRRALSQLDRYKQEIGTIGSVDGVPTMDNRRCGMVDGGSARACIAAAEAEIAAEEKQREEILKSR